MRGYSSSNLDWQSSGSKEAGNRSQSNQRSAGRVAGARFSSTGSRCGSRRRASDHLWRRWLGKDVDFAGTCQTSGSGIGVRWQKDETEEQLGFRVLTHLQNESNSLPRYDAVLVDEAQDFEPNWFRCLLTSMTDPENGDLLIAADGCQSLYRRRKVNWSQLGIKARGRTVSSGFRLDRNYRNSREIIALAESFAYSASDSEDMNAIQEVRVNMTRCERTSGVSPLLVECADRRSELLQAYEIVRELLQGTWRGRPVGVHAPEDIAILYPGAQAEEKEQLQKFVDWMTGKGIPAAWQSKDFRARDQIGNKAVHVQTIHSAKGLQYRAVIVLWADKLPRLGIERDELLGERRLLYVAMTRAISLLAVTASRRSAFINEISATPAVEIVRRQEPCQVGVEMKKSTAS